MIPDVPLHWKTCRLKDVATLVEDLLPEATDPDYEFQYVDIGNVTSESGIVGTDRVIFANAPSRARRRVVPGDSIVSTVRTYLKAVAVVGETHDPLVVSTGFAVLRPKAELDPEYFWRVLQSEEFIGNVVARSQGIGYPAIAPNKLMALPFWYPTSMDEQVLMVKILREKIAQIDSLIKKTQSLLRLRREWAQELAAAAVLQGIRSQPIVDSGVEWLGSIQKDWNIGSPGQLFRERDERGKPHLPLLEVSLNTGVQIREFADDRIERVASDLTTLKVARAGDLVFNKMRLWQGAVGVAPVDGLVSTDYTVAEPCPGISSHYYAEVLRTSRCKTEINRYSYGIVPDRNRIYWENFKQIRLPIPPLNEQTSIVQFIDRQRAAIHFATRRVERAIRLLGEYRAALISAAVTGKLDRRYEVA